jgi:hypothetical protein
MANAPNVVTRFLCVQFNFVKCGVETFRRFVTTYFLRVKIATEKRFRFVGGYFVSLLKLGSTECLDVIADVVSLMKTGRKLIQKLHFIFTLIITVKPC